MKITFDDTNLYVDGVTFPKQYLSIQINPFSNYFMNHEDSSNLVSTEFTYDELTDGDGNSLSNITDDISLVEYIEIGSWRTATES